jgi:YHS domain-containing protein
MLRTIIYLLATVLVISFLRGVIGLITKSVGDLFREEPGAGKQARRATAPGMGGELVKDPVCGMYVSPAVAHHKTLGGTKRYFCSEKCRDEFKG